MIICIAGPTGIGKTKLSVMLAKKYNAFIVNADATQIYKEFNIGSAKVTEEEMEGVKHYLLDIKSPDEDFSVMEYQKLAREIIENNKDKNIVVVGGTGLYLKALFYDYKFEKNSEENFDNYTNDELYKMVLVKDCNVDIHPNNRIRLINFLKKENVSSNGDKLLYEDVIFIGLTLDREKLYERANLRVDEMIKLGLEDEVRNLQKKYPNSNILKRAIGYKEFLEYFKGNMTFDDAVNSIKQNTRHYIKRQYTWFNNKMSLNWFNVNLEDFNKTYEEIEGFIESLNSK